MTFGLTGFWGIHGVLHTCCRLNSVFITNPSINSAPGLFCFFCDGDDSSGILRLGWAVCLLYGLTWGQLYSLPRENSLFLPQNRIISYLLCIMLWPTLNSLLLKSLKLFSKKVGFFTVTSFKKSFVYLKLEYYTAFELLYFLTY